jgi:hypothetical protein
MPLKLRPTAFGSTEKPGRQVYLAVVPRRRSSTSMRCPDDRHSKAADRWIAFLNPIFWEAAFGVATWSVAAYVAILFVAWMRPLLERLFLTYAVGAIFTLLMQT